MLALLVALLFISSVQADYAINGRFGRVHFPNLDLSGCKMNEKPAPAPPGQCLPLPGINCPVEPAGPQLRIPSYDRLLVATLDTTDINNNIFAVLDIGRERAKKFLSDCEITQLNEAAFNWYKTQYGFDDVVGPIAPYGVFLLINHFVNATTGVAYNETVTAYPYANVEAWKPTIDVDSAFPRTADGQYYWVDFGLIGYPTTTSIFKAGPNAGLSYKPGVLFWYDAFMIVRRNYTKLGVEVPACIRERFISRTTTYSDIVPNIRDSNQNFLISQLVTEAGEIGYYNDFLTKMNGPQGIWPGNGTEWETSRLTVTFPQYSRPIKYGPRNIYWPFLE